MTIAEAAARVDSTTKAISQLLYRYPHLCTRSIVGRKMVVDIPESSIEELHERTGNRGRPTDRPFFGQAFS